MSDEKLLLALCEEYEWIGECQEEITRYEGYPLPQKKWQARLEVAQHRYDTLRAEALRRMRAKRNEGVFNDSTLSIW